MVVASIFWMMNELKYVYWMEGVAISIHLNLYRFLC
jgi:hypothetical protein